MVLKKKVAILNNTKKNPNFYYLKKLAIRNEVDDSVGVKEEEINFGTISGQAANVDNGEVTETEPSRNAEVILPRLLMAKPAGGAFEAGL